MPKTMKQINFDNRQLKAIDDYAKDERISRAEAIRDIVDYFFQKKK